MMREHEELDRRIRMAPGSDSAYRAHLNYHLTQEESRICVAKEGADAASVPVGFCLVTINRNLPMFLPPDYGYLSDLVVDPSVRRRGVGRALVEDVRAWLNSREVETIQLQAYIKNTRATDFWTSLGFSPFYERMWLEVK